MDRELLRPATSAAPALALPPEKKPMHYWSKLTLATITLFLLGSAIWANVTSAPMSEMRGAWVTQAMRGMAY